MANAYQRDGLLKQKTRRWEHLTMVNFLATPIFKQGLGLPCLLKDWLTKSVLPGVSHECIYILNKNNGNSFGSKHAS